MSISISNLTVSYGSENVISGLDLDIAEGSFFTLLGPSGCGKTTLLRTIAGFVGATAGRIAFSGRDVTQLPPHRRDIGMVFQDYALFPDKTVFENVAYGLRARRVREAEIRQKVPAALERVGLGHLAQRRPAALSGRQRQRVALARALVIEPQVLLMDEPLSNLDAKLRIQVRETITELQREARITTVFVTHDQEEALSMSDKIGVMNRGVIEQLGTPKEIYANPRTGYVADFVGAANRMPVRIGKPDGPDRDAGVPVEVAGSTIRARCDAGVTGDQGLLIMRPEDLHLSAGQPDGRQHIPGTIARRQYLGSRTSYKVQLRDGQFINVDLHGEGHDSFPTDSAVFVGIEVRNARVIAP